jgi:serine/threonine-protein kinase
MPEPKAQDGTSRYCPSCGTKTDAEFCPADGVPTLVRKKLDVDATVVREGDVIDGRYRVTGILGRGGFGAVYSAEHTGTQQKVALKMMLTSSEGVDENEIRRFYREAQITASLKHQNTVRVFDVGQTKAGALYIAMELLLGPSLEGVLKDRWRDAEVLSEREAVNIAIPVLKSLHEAHTNNLVHRDLKPANIMLADLGDDEPTVKVLDFGIARAQDSSLTGAGTALGTPAYMSPEQCQGLELDGRSDLYSLGIILYRCVCGVPPFNDRNPLTVMFHHTTTPPPELHGAAKTVVSEGFGECLRKVLAKNREDRFESAREMRLALEAVAAGESLSQVLAATLRAAPTSPGLATPRSGAVRVVTGTEEAIAPEDVNSDTMMSTRAAQKAGLSPDAALPSTGTTSKKTRVVTVDAAAEDDATGAQESVPTPSSGATTTPPPVVPATPALAIAPAAVPVALPPAPNRQPLWIGVAIALAMAGGIALALVAGGGPTPSAQELPADAATAAAATAPAAPLVVAAPAPAAPAAAPQPLPVVPAPPPAPPPAPVAAAAPAAVAAPAVDATPKAKPRPSAKKPAAAKREPSKQEPPKQEPNVPFIPD